MTTNGLHVFDDEAGGKTLKLSEEQRTTRVLIQSTSITTMSAWRVATVRAALDAHEQGDLSGTAVLADAIERDPQIQAAITTRILAFMARSELPLTMEPARGIDDRRAESVAKTVDRLWDRACPDNEVVTLLRDYILLGEGVARDDMPVIDGEEVPRLRRLRPLGLYWDEFEGVHKYIDKKGATHVVTPGENGWVLLTHGGDGWMRGAIRSIGLTWLSRLFTHRDWNRWTEKHGLPILLLSESSAGTADVNSAASKQAIFDQFRRLSAESVVRLPQGQHRDEPGWEAKFLEPTTLSYEGFERFYKVLRDDAIAVILGLDPDAGTKGIGGDEASVRERTKNDFLASDASALSRVLREQLWMPWVRRNIDARKPELAPYPRWETRPPADLGKEADTLLKVADVVERYERLGLDTAPVFERFGVKPKSGQKVTLPTPTPVASPPSEPEAPKEPEEA